VDASETGPTVGQIGAQVANEVVRILAEFTGRGATRSRAFVHGDVVVCLYEESMTKVERSLIERGNDDVVRQLRDSFQRASENELVSAVERVTGRKVVRFLSGTSTGADAGVEVFVLDPETPDAAGA
jgi:uncharacterized protein YbcI